MSFTSSPALQLSVISKGGVLLSPRIFIAVAKIPFDALEDNPITWEYDKFGKPDVYLLMRGVRNVTELDHLKAKKEIKGFDAVKDHIPVFDTYEAAELYRAELYNKLKNYGYKKRLEYVRAR